MSFPMVEACELVSLYPTPALPDDPLVGSALRTSVNDESDDVLYLLKGNCRCPFFFPAVSRSPRTNSRSNRAFDDDAILSSFELGSRPIQLRPWHAGSTLQSDGVPWPHVRILPASCHTEHSTSDSPFRWHFFHRGSGNE